MSSRTSFGEIDEGDFSNLLQTLSANPKGRSFLAEYRRRAQPDETLGVVKALRRIEGQLATIRDQLEPERVAGELHRIAVTLEIALDGAEPDACSIAKRRALVERARLELAALATSLSGAAETS